MDTVECNCGRRHDSVLGAKSKTKEELVQLSEDIINQKVFTSNMLEDYDFLPIVFVPLGKMHITPKQASKIGMVYEYLNKMSLALGEDIPVFTTFQVLGVDDTKFVNEYVCSNISRRSPCADLA